MQFFVNFCTAGPECKKWATRFFAHKRTNVKEKYHIKICCFIGRTVQEKYSICFY